MSGGPPAPHLQPLPVSGADSAEANFGGGLLPVTAEDGHAASGALDASLLVDNHSPHFPGPAVASPSLFAGNHKPLISHAAL